MVNSVIPPTVSQQYAHLSFRQSKFVYVRTETLVMKCGGGEGRIRSRLWVVVGGEDDYLSNAAIAPACR